MSKCNYCGGDQVELVECEDCYGMGEVTARRGYESEEMDCPTCNGTGEICKKCAKDIADSQARYEAQQFSVDMQNDLLCQLEE